MKKDKVGVSPKKLLAENTSRSLEELIHQRFLVLGGFDLSPIAREPIRRSHNSSIYESDQQCS
jgi:hypothetical protein